MEIFEKFVIELMRGGLETSFLSESVCHLALDFRENPFLRMAPKCFSKGSLAEFRMLHSTDR